MLGYGLVNSSVHDLCLTEIIFSFLSRSSLYLSPYYYSLLSKKGSLGQVPDSDLQILANVFFEEERILYKLSLKEQGLTDQQISNSEEEIIYKYILSANIIYNQNYNYDGKDLNKVIEDGTTAFKIILSRTLDNFFSFLTSSTSKQKINIPEIKLENPTKSDDFLLNLIKYSTFVFESNSIIRSLFPTDKRLGAEFNNYSNLDKNPITRVFYSTMGGGIPDCDELPTFKPSGVGPDPCKLIEYPNYNYYSTGGKFLNYGRPSENSLNMSPILFGEFYYSVKKDKINDLYNNYFSKVKVDDPNSNIFYDYQYSLSEFTSYEKTLKQILGEKFGAFKDSAYVVNIKSFDFLNDINGPTDSFDLFFEYKNLETGVIKTYTANAQGDKGTSFFNNLPTFAINNKNELKVTAVWKGDIQYSVVDDVFLTNPLIFSSKNYNIIKQTNKYLWKGTKIGLIINDDYTYAINYEISNPIESSSSKIEKIKVENYDLEAISRKEILKYFKFSFREVKGIINYIRNTNESFEDYFDLNYRIMLNLNADLVDTEIKDSQAYFDSLKNHYLHNLFNIPNLENNLFPPYYKNHVFTSNLLSPNANYHDTEAPLLSGKFYNNYKEGSLVYNDVTKTFIFLASQTENLEKGANGYYDFEQNQLIKMLFKKENIVFTTDHIYAIQTDLNTNDPYYASYNIKKYIPFTDKNFIGTPINGSYQYKCSKDQANQSIGTFKAENALNLLKTNYLLTLIDFKVDTSLEESKSKNIYYSLSNDPKESLFNVKNDHYENIFNYIKNNLDTNPKLKSILDNLDYDKISSGFSIDYNKILSTYIDNLKQENSKIISFYTKSVNNKAKINLLYARNNALNILNQQIRVLENG